ncbi:transmembrane protein 94-like [Haliotis rufescens]|uniref:transmembrane protein 94-like n=1 Tax=Haliotis rufescens TaxID=6454 RepID=UPI00201FAB77|nr:transmembrane protein 94-like [Haliotis rufescens]
MDPLDVEGSPRVTNGYTTEDALFVLCQELQREIDKYDCQKRDWLKLLRSFVHTNVQSLYHWTTAVCAVLLACVLIATYAIHINISNPFGMCTWWLVLAFFLVLAVVFNSALNICCVLMTRREYSDIIKRVLKKLWDCRKITEWNASNYPNSTSPLTPCVSLQWTLRDGERVNLPQPLLVIGDIILLRPGQVAPGKCRELEESDDAQELVLMAGEVYSPEIEGVSDSLAGPQGRVPLQTRKFLLLETPFLQNIRDILGDDISRPVSILDNERHLLVQVWLERRIIPLVLVIMTLTNVLRLTYQENHVGHWSEMLFILLIHSLLPLLTLVFPIMWVLINIYGQARIFSVFEVARRFKQAVDESFDSMSTISVDEARVDMSGQLVFRWFRELFTGTAPVVSRQANVLHVLGSVTSLCCVDKKGILSWPNPSAEKIFFFTPGHRKKVSRTSDIAVIAQTPLTDTVFSDIPEEEAIKKKKDSGRRSSHSSVQGVQNHIEVLDLTHDAKTTFGLHFDDPTWKRHMNSLKPLGLNILLNTCNLATVEWYTQFSDHVACAALEHDETVAVVNRRCMCDLAKEIGFSQQALRGFSHDECLGMYRQVPDEESAKERVNRAKSFIQHKIPMPNMVSVVTRDKTSGMCQLLTQGTADIVLDCCTDYWTGNDLCVLSETDKKKIVDFYHRNSMAAYCTAFSYRPLAQNISPLLESMYIELPDKFVRLLNSGRPNRTSECEDPESSALLTKSSRSFSVDSLMESESVSSIDDVPGCHQAQSNQVFIGMVTLQYQARQEIVQLIEKLENACIRFVHFSKENELRSRVFSEKMGLEAGWNCHISLMSHDNFKLEGNMSGPESVCHGDVSQRPSHHSSRHSTDDLGRDTAGNVTSKAQSATDAVCSRSFSAPSIINLEETQVKFDVDNISIKEDQCTVTIKENSPVVVSGDKELDEEEEEEEGEGEGESQRLMSPKRQRGWSSSDDDAEGETDFQSDSRYTSSYVTDNTDDSLTGALDNRAKLPRGIENIRPHLASTDNVPLLVNLFTDCTPEATQEMMKIMQENGEVVLCMGSCANIQNTPLFLQADCSFSLEPLYPQVCAKQRVMVEPWDEDKPTPMQIASALISMPCPLSFRRDDNVSLVQLIAEARHFTQAMRNCFYLMLCFHLSLTLTQVLASILLLPPTLDTRHLLWLLLVVIPLLSLTLMGNPVDPRIMTMATRKNKDHVNGEMLGQYIVQFSLRFLPSVIVPLLCYGLTLNSFCHTTPNVTCAVYTFSDGGNQTVFHNWYEKYSGGIILAQNILLFLLVFYFACISMSFVHWSDHLWKKLPFTNKLWSIVTPTLLLVQIIYFVGDVAVQSRSAVNTLSLSSVHPAVWALGMGWPVVIVTINELVKRREIKLAVRHQKRARLDFGTKLGMNSPF